MTVMFPGRSKESCQEQWIKHQKKYINKSNWIEEEDDTLKILVRKLGPNEWTKVAFNFNMKYKKKMRTAIQCQNRWIYHLNTYAS